MTDGIYRIKSGKIVMDAKFESHEAALQWALDNAKPGSKYEVVSQSEIGRQEQRRINPRKAEDETADIAVFVSAVNDQNFSENEHYIYQQALADAASLIDRHQSNKGDLLLKYRDELLRGRPTP